MERTHAVTINVPTNMTYNQALENVDMIIALPGNIPALVKWIKESSNPDHYFNKSINEKWRTLRKLVNYLLVNQRSSFHPLPS